MTTNSKLWVRKTRLRIILFRRKRFRGSSWSEKLKKRRKECVIRKKTFRKIVSSDTRASPGRTDATVQIFLQTHTSRRLETNFDDYVGAVTVEVAAYRCRKHRIKNINRLALVLGLLDEDDAVVSREHICSLCNVRGAAAVVVTSWVHIIR